MESIDWLELCRRCVTRQRELFAATLGIAERTVYEGRGEGGDMTLELDRRCEDVIFDELEALADEGASLLAVSEERGELTLGKGEPTARVVIDPIDGSLNARRTIPSFSTSIAVASGETMDAVDFGFVYDFGADEEFAATRGEGATVNGRPIPRELPDTGLEIVGLESADPKWVMGPIASLEGNAYRLRVVGSIAITLCYVAAGRFDAMLSARPCRSVDAAAAQLLVRECGGAVEIAGLGLEGAPLDLSSRYPIAAARRAEHLQTVVDAQSASPAFAQ
ncbi:MAG: inositol monophosphatase family protein [Solirubrobacterales bacterium]